MYKATFIKKEQVADGTFSFWFSLHERLHYTPGQFVELTLPHDSNDSRGEKRWFTLSSSPSEEHISITTKLAEKPSSFKKHLFTLTPGDPVAISDAMGDFVLPRDTSRPIVFAVAGIGVTPARSMLTWLQKQRLPYKIHMLLAAKKRSEIPFLDLFANTVDELKLFLSSADNKRLTAQHVIEEIEQHKSANCLIFIAGPEHFSEVMRDDLVTLGVPSQRLIIDYFHGYEQ